MTIPDPLAFLALALLGGAVALDGTSVGQFMLSRPLVAGALGGLAMGGPGEGIVAGLVLEALHLAVLPVGAAKYPEGGPPAVVAGAAFAGTGHSYAALLGIVLFALAWETVSGLTVSALRQFNVRFDGVAGGIDPAAVGRRHAAPIALDFLRGALLTLAGAVLLEVLLALVDFTGFPENLARLALGLSVIASCAAGLRLFGRSRYRFFVAGAVAGAALVLLR